MSVRLSRRQLQAGERIRVLAVDDSVVIRRLITHALGEDPTVEIVGTASNGAIALQRIPQLNPDVITLDLEMPEMGGMEMLRHMRKDFPDVRVIIFSTLSQRGATETFEALSLGADDYVTKASNEGSLDVSITRLRNELIPKIKQFFLPSVPVVNRVQPLPQASDAMPARKTPKVVVIGVSTGGPIALSTVLPDLPENYPLPILVVQHMPPLFTRLLAERLNVICKMQVVEAEQDELVEAGKIYIAPGDFHMKVTAKDDATRIVLDQTVRQNSCRPAVDALFASVGEVYGGNVIAAVLTGMGMDGLRGAQILKAQGARVIAQDEATSVVWGMPGAIVGAGLADAVLPLNMVVPEILRYAPRS